MFYIVLAICILALVFGIYVYNSLVQRRQSVEKSWSQITVLLKRRHDLIPNLVETVRGYATHEQSTFEQVTRARTSALQASSPSAVAQAEEGLGATLKTLFAVSEQYPELKANQNFLALQEELSETENKLEDARTTYNHDVMKYNVATESFPGNIMAQQYGFTLKEYFEIPEQAEKVLEEAPAVRF